MATALFIDEVYLNKRVPVSGNVDGLLIRTAIESAQDTLLENILGTDFYNHLQNAVINNTVNTDERTLLESFVQPALAWTAAEKLVTPLSLQVRNKGVMINSSDNSQPASKGDREELRASFRSYAAYYVESLQRYLCEFYTLFPKYKTPDPDSLRFPRSQAYDCDIYIGDQHVQDIKDFARKYLL